VGKRLTRLLALRGHEVIALVHKPPPSHDREYFSSSRVSVVQGDVRRIDFGTLPAGTEAVVTLAQSARFREFPAQAEEIFDVNVTANLRLLQWASGVGIRRFVHASSGGIYGGRLGAHFHETDLLAVDSPLGFYLGTKLCSEVVFQNYRQFFDTAVILRPFFIYGPGQRRDMFVARLIDAVRSGSAVRLQGPNGLRVNPVYVEDAASAFAEALKLTGYHLINLAGPDVLTLREICDAIGRATGKPPVFEYQPGEPVDYVGDISQVSTKLDCIRTSFAEGLARTLSSTSALPS
jgi:nucleoside-diphosphate-sugar epimerase